MATKKKPVGASVTSKDKHKEEVKELRRTQKEDAYTIKTLHKHVAEWKEKYGGLKRKEIEVADQKPEIARLQKEVKDADGMMRKRNDRISALVQQSDHFEKDRNLHLAEVERLSIVVRNQQHRGDDWERKCGQWERRNTATLSVVRNMRAAADTALLIDQI